MKFHNLICFFVFFGAVFLFSEEPAALPIEIANAGFESVSGKKVELWQVYAWSRPAEGTTVEVSSGAVEGQNCVSISAVDKGASGLVSPVIKLDAKLRIYRLKFWVKRSADYAGNQGWVFYSFHNGGKFLGTVEAKLKLAKLNEWEEQTALLFDDEIPVGAAEARLNLASSGTSGKGRIFFDKVSLEGAEEGSVFGAAPRSPFKLRSESVGNWVVHGEPIVFKVQNGIVPSFVKSLRGRVQNARGEPVAEISVSQEELASKGWSFVPPSPGFFEVRFDAFRTGSDKPVAIVESFVKNSPKGGSKTFTRDLHAFVSSTATRPMNERSPVFGFSDQLNKEPFMQLADKVGFSFARIHAIPWGAQFTDTNQAMEPAKGVYRFERFDDHMDLVRKYGFSAVGNVNYTPRWASPHPEDDKTYICVKGWAAYAPKNVDDFGDFLKVLVKRYGDTIKTWELWNEPHLPGGSVFWLDTPENFVKLLQNGYTALKSVQPESEIWIGGLGGRRYLPFYKVIMAQGAGKYFDRLALHGSWTTPMAFDEINKLNGVAPKPWVSSEHHTILINSTPDIPTEEQLSKRMMLDFLNHLKHGVEKLAVFELANLDEIETLPFASKEGIFTHASGFFRVKPSIEPRLAACVAQHFFSVLGRKTVYQNEYALGQGQKAVSFENDGGQLVVLWSEGSSKPVDAGLKDFLKAAKVTDWEGKPIQGGGFTVEAGKIYYLKGPKTAFAMKPAGDVLVSEKDQKVKSYPAPSASAPLTALLDEAGQITAKSITWIEEGFRFEGKEKPSEFEARLALGSGARGIDIIVEVKDRSFVQNGKPGQYWGGDSLQFAFDTLGQSVPQDQVQFQVALEKDTAVIFKEMSPYIGGDIPQRWTPSGQVAKYAQAFIEPISGGLRYKIHIDYTELYPFAMNAKEPLRFSILINNNNGSGRLGWLEWGGGIGKEREPAFYGKVFWK